MRSRERTWLTRERLLACASLLAVAEFAAFAFCVAGTHGLIVPLDHPGSTDFASFHAAGALANAGAPWLAYDRVAHHAAETMSSGIATAYNYFFYPPVYLLICAPLARLPYLVAFILFQAVGAVACFAAIRLIRRDVPWVALAAFPGLWWAFGTGQNALLTAALFAAGTALIDRRPWLAGVCLGALCYKPHFGLLLPVALLAGWHWRTVLAAGGTVAALIAASLALFGVGTWHAFLELAGGAGDVYAAHAIFMSGLTSPFGVLLSLGAGRAVAIAVQTAVTLCLAVLVAVVWRMRAPLPLRAAVLLTATPLAVPVLMFYDLMLVFVALVWLSRLWPAEPRSWRLAASSVVFLAPLLSGKLVDGSPWPVAFLTAALAFGVTVATAWRMLVAPRDAIVPAAAGAA